jgi:hypothetical protein
VGQSIACDCRYYARRGVNAANTIVPGFRDEQVATIVHGKSRRSDARSGCRTAIPAESFAASACNRLQVALFIDSANAPRDGKDQVAVMVKRQGARRVEARFYRGLSLPAKRSSRSGSA